MKRLITLLAVVFLFVAVAGACDNAKAADHQAQMKAVLSKVTTTWDQVQKATSPAAKDAAMKAHSDALAELQAMHEKHMAAAGEKKMDCRAMMDKMKAEGKECKMECCKDHKKAEDHASHPAPKTE